MIGTPILLCHTSSTHQPGMAEAVPLIGINRRSLQVPLRNQANHYEQDIPECGENSNPCAWLPDWAGDSLWIDPMRNLFSLENLVRNFERKQQEKRTR